MKKTFIQVTQLVKVKLVLQENLRLLLHNMRLLKMKTLIETMGLYYCALNAEDPVWVELGAGQQPSVQPQNYPQCHSSCHHALLHRQNVHLQPGVD